jgi:hypothetical protein
MICFGDSGNWATNSGFDHGFHVSEELPICSNFRLYFGHCRAICKKLFTSVG